MGVALLGGSIFSINAYSKSVVKVSSGRCVNVGNKDCHTNHCSECRYVCPTSAIGWNECTAPTIWESQCIGCWACISVCPANAFHKPYY